MTSTPRLIRKGHDSSLPTASVVHLTVHAEDNEARTDEEIASLTTRMDAVNVSENVVVQSPTACTQQSDRHVQALGEGSESRGDGSVNDGLPGTVDSPVNSFAFVPSTNTLDISEGQKNTLPIRAHRSLQSNVVSPPQMSASPSTKPHGMPVDDATPTIARGRNDVNLRPTVDPIIVAHDKAAVALMDMLDIAWGVQYEIARGVSCELWKWSDVTEDRLSLLQGSNFERGPLVFDVFGKGNDSGSSFTQSEEVLYVA